MKKNPYEQLLAGILAGVLAGIVLFLGAAFLDRQVSSTALLLAFVLAVIVTGIVHWALRARTRYYHLYAIGGGLTAGAVAIYVAVLLGFHAVAVQIDSPTGGGIALCRIIASGGEVTLRGTSRGVNDPDSILVWVDPPWPAKDGWFLQTATNVVSQFEREGEFVAVAQIGNIEAFPRDGDTISLAVTIVTVEQAKELRRAAKGAPNVPQRLPQSHKARDIARDIDLQIVE